MIKINGRRPHLKESPETEEQHGFNKINKVRKLPEEREAKRSPLYKGTTISFPVKTTGYWAALTSESEGRI